MTSTMPPHQSPWLLFLCGGLCWTSAAKAQSCAERLDNGVDMTGWVRSTTNHHGMGDGWTVEGGAFIGRQTAGQRGGILMTERTFSDIDATFEVQIDWGCDSGFYIRTTDGDRAYQVTLDHLDGNSVGGVWGESFSTEVSQWGFTLTDGGAVAVPTPGETPLIDPSAWPTLWDPMGFNEVRVRMEGNPPHIQVWISGTLVNDFQDTQVRGDVMESGPIAIQVHEGDRWVDGGVVRFRNIRVQDLTVECMAPEPTPDAGAPPVTPPVSDPGAGGASTIFPPATGGGMVRPPATEPPAAVAGAPAAGSAPTAMGTAEPTATAGTAVTPPTTSTPSASQPNVEQSAGCALARDSRTSSRSLWLATLLALAALTRRRS